MTLETFKSFERYISRMILLVFPVEILFSLICLGILFTYDVPCCYSITKLAALFLLTCLCISVIILISLYSVLPIFITTVMFMTITINHLLENFISNCYLVLLNAIVSFIISLGITMIAPYLLLFSHEKKQIKGFIMNGV